MGKDVERSGRDLFMVLYQHSPIRVEEFYDKTSVRIHGLRVEI
jgi:hypothetical protein